MSTVIADEPQRPNSPTLCDIGTLHDVISKWATVLEEATRRFENLPRPTRDRLDQRSYPEEAIDRVTEVATYWSTAARRETADENRRLADLLERVEHGFGALLRADDTELVANIIRILQKLPTRSLEQLRFFTHRSLSKGAGTSYLILQSHWDQKRSQVSLEARHLYRLPEALLHEINLDN